VNSILPQSGAGGFSLAFAFGLLFSVGLLSNLNKRKKKSSSFFQRESFS
jgi:hypothetical protein